MESYSFERDRALIEAMQAVGEPDTVIEGFLMCLEISDGDRQALRDSVGLATVAPLPDIASGDVIEMNPLLSQPQRAKSR
jgi:hypothetical protein